MSHDEGFEFGAEVPFEVRAAPSEDGIRANLELFEDGRPLGPSPSPRSEIQQAGHGAYTHLGTTVRFSTSDNSDPNTNGRRYVASYPVAESPVLVALVYLAATAVLVGAGLALLGLVGLASRGRGTSMRWVVVESLLVLLGLTLAVYAFPQVEVFRAREANTVAHLAFAEKIGRTGVLYPAHCLYHLSVIVVHRFVRDQDWIRSGMVVVFVLYLVLAVLLWRLFVRALGGSNRGHDPYFPPLLAGALLIVAPITMPTWSVQNVYFGYLVPHQLWSQTTIALKPFALLTLVLGARVFHPTAPHRTPWMIAALSASAAISTVAKPSFMICFLPALGLLLILRRLAGRRADLAVYVGALLVPNALLILAQYVRTYLHVQHTDAAQAASGQDIGVTIAPLLVMGTYSGVFHPSPWWLLPKFLLSILFPLLVTLSFHEKAIRDWRLALAWLTFGFGCFSTYFLAEGRYPLSGNFVWSGQITLFLLFVMAAVFFVEQVVQPSRATWRAMVIDRRSTICTLALALHVVAGLYHMVHPLSL